ncbi:acyl-CoA dehydrogenase family protein [Rubrivirga sp.]|uniref:acyl-CoA dehydrogenase family protein n=1 Tax=Rubrivirga sp. TaxID=1885344 RepID=UPI003C75D374
MDTSRLAKLAQKADLEAVLTRLEAMTAEEMADLLGASSAAPKKKPYQPPTPDTDFYNLFDRALTEPQQHARQTIRRFMLDGVAPVINDYWERGEMPFEVVPGLRDALREAFGPDPAKTYCTDPFLTGLVSMEIPRVDPSVGTFLGVTWGLAMYSIWMFGSDEQKEKWMGPLESFDAIGSWALTEPEHGSDAALGLATTAERRGDTWVLNGAKKWSGNATFADVTVIWARDLEDGQVKGFLVEKGTPGFEVSKLEGKIAKRSVQNVDIVLEDVEVAESDRLPGVRSFRDVAGQLAIARAGVAWEACGMAMGLYEMTLDYCTRRVQFGKPIAGFQLVQEGLVRMLGNVVAIQGMMLGLAGCYDEPKRLHERASLAKVFCVDKMRETASIGRGLLGGNGILLEHGVARLFADAEAVYSYEGSREMNVLITGRAVTGLSAFV